ncbi:MAG: F0F1 ATP synthase subunit delta [Desulfovibrionaceae bacterium]|nr:F0F1 ATP synthase subunit delta [Desulfovibrionaceae bacterium]
MTGNIIARRYAKALFSLGLGQGGDAVSAYGKDLEELAAVLENVPELMRVFANPIFVASEKKAVLDGVLAKLSVSPVVKNFLGLLAEKERLSFLPEIAVYFRTLLDEAQGVVRGRLVTALNLAEARRDQIKSKLEAQTGKKLVLDFAVDPEILGGVMLKVGDKVLDASLRAQLQILKEQIKRGD